MADTTLYSPQMLWKDFDSSLPLKDSIVSEDVFDNVTYKNIYFSGRETSSGRVRIHGVYAQNKPTGKKQSKGALLIIPDYTETVNSEIINLYVKQGYSVLMVDYRGESDCDDYTKYPDEISYANYNKCGRALDYVDTNAKETCWYEWVAVMKYAVSYLQAQPEIDRIGVLGIKNGANIGWMLCGSDNRVCCFASLFGSGWRAYKGCFKNSENDDIQMDEERIRYIAGVEAQAYAQNVKCPVLFLTSTNSPNFDVDRSADTLIRIPETETSAKKSKKDKDGESDICERINNYAPRLRDVLDGCCEKDVDLFLAKYLLNFKIIFPSEPKLSVSVDGKNVKTDVEIDFSETKRTKRVEVYLSEGTKNPAFRDWNLMTEIKGKSEKTRTFQAKINGNSSFINLFALVEYKSGVTICSKITSKKIELIPARDNKLIYSTKDKTGSFSVYDVKKYSVCGLFFNDNNYLISAPGADDICGIYSKYGLISYKVNDRFIRLYERSLIKMDVYCTEYTVLKLVLMVADSKGESQDYVARLTVNGASVWQNILLKCTEFKSDVGRPIRNFSDVSAVRIETEANCIINNILLI